MRQEYSVQYLQRILDEYADRGEIREHQLFTSGFENSNYLARTESGDYVIKVFEAVGATPDTIDFEVGVMDTSYKAGVKTPHVLRNSNGNLVTAHEEKRAIVMDFVEGENMYGKEMSDDLMYDIGRQMGKMDTALSVFKDGSKTRQNYEYDLKNLLLLESEMAGLPAHYDRDIFDQIFSAFREQKAKFDAMPTGIIHNDVVAHNILAKDGTLQCILDFTDMAFSPYVQNIAVALTHTVLFFNWQPHQAGILIKGYREFRSFSSEEASLVYDLILARYANIILAVLNWDRRFGPDEQRATYMRDNYEFMKKFLDFGRAEFNTCIGL